MRQHPLGELRQKSWVEHTRIISHVKEACRRGRNSRAVREISGRADEVPGAARSRYLLLRAEQITSVRHVAGQDGGPEAPSSMGLSAVGNRAWSRAVDPRCTALDISPTSLPSRRRSRSSVGLVQIPATAWVGPCRRSGSPGLSESLRRSWDLARAADLRPPPVFANHAEVGPGQEVFQGSRCPWWIVLGSMSGNRGDILESRRGRGVWPLQWRHNAADRSHKDWAKDRITCSRLWG